MFIYFWSFRTKYESPTSIESGNETLEQKIFFRNTNLSTPVKRTWKEMKKWTHTFAAILFYVMILRQEYSKKYSMYMFWCHWRGLPELKFFISTQNNCLDISIWVCVSIIIKALSAYIVIIEIDFWNFVQV